MDTSDYHIAVSPRGRLVLRCQHGAATAARTAATGRTSPTARTTTTANTAKAEEPAALAREGWLKRVVRGFADSPPAGLFALAATRPELPPSRSLAYWRDFAGRYLTERCRTPEGGALDPADPPSAAELGTLLLTAPPMQGAEYLQPETLESIWRELDEWLTEAVKAAGGGLAGYLKRHAPIWHQVGRVCFHLAENKDDPEYPFAFLATYAPRLSSMGRIQYVPLGQALEKSAGARDRKALMTLLAPVHAASQRSPWVKELLDSGDLFHPLLWDADEAYRFLKAAPLLEESGLVLRLPDWWRQRSRPQVKVTIGDKKVNRLDTDAILDFNLSLAFGGEEFTEEEWRAISASGDGLIRIGGRWVEVDQSKLAEALAHWKKLEAAAESGGLSFAEGMRLLAGTSGDLTAESDEAEELKDWSSVTAGRWFGEVLARLKDPADIKASGPGRALRGTLRPYQEDGHKWLWFLTNLGLGACLADDMGLGKTIQVLALLLSIKREKKEHAPSLLVMPASLLGNWKSEIERFAPSLETRFVHGSETTPAELAQMGTDPERALEGVDLVMTTYGMVMRQSWLAEVRWHLVILDEAQAIKNPAARQTRAVKKVTCDARIALTGTPVENRLGDLWSLFDFLCPGLLGSAARFKGFVKRLEESETDRYAPLRNLVQPYILRRLKTDRTIIADLPEKSEMKAFCGLSRGQAALYEREVRQLAHALQGAQGMDRRGLILSALMRFKQICNHPSHFLGDGGYDPRESGKFDRLRALCEEIASRQEKVLVFTQFRETTDPLADYLETMFGRAGLVLHGGVPVRKRKALVDAFQSEDGPPFFVLSLKAGGTGLNLTSASHVIHFDRWWNPAVENQATDRAFRIGQQRNVLVHKFVCRGTVEERIDLLIEEKTELASSILKADGAAVLTELDDTELLRIVALDVDRAKL